MLGEKYKLPPVNLVRGQAIQSVCSRLSSLSMLSAIRKLRIINLDYTVKVTLESAIWISPKLHFSHY